MEQTFYLDEYDLMILRELKHNSKQSYGQLATKIKKPKSFVYRRITKLEQVGIISRYLIAINYEKIGRSIIAFVLISVTPGTEKSQNEIAEEISTIPQIYEVHVITGEYDILAKVRTVSVDELGDIVVNRIRSIKGVAKTITNVSLIRLQEEIMCEKV